MSETILTIDKLRKQYVNGPNTLKVLEDVSFSLGAGGTLVITGESGSGKSTLLNLIGGLDTPSSGVISSCGYSVHDLPEEGLTEYRNKIIGFIFQFHYLLKDFTALENTALPAWIAGMSKKQGTERARELIHEVKLEHRINHYPSQLSGGERQRAAVARALVNNPRLVLADEPTGNLDEENSRMVMDLLLNLVKKRSMSMILVTHDKSLAAAGTMHMHIHHKGLDSE